MKALPPKADELEISVFGPGYGECVLVHLGEGQWMIVDSCRDQRSKRQPALAYLDRMGVEPEAAVRVVVATHWHRDHVRGLTEVVGRCTESDFWTSQALTSREALVLTGRLGGTELTAQSPLRELHGVLERLRVRRDGTGAPTIKTAAAGSTIYRRVRGGVVEASVTALSPHDAAVDFTKERFRQAQELDDPGVFTAPDLHPNHAAIVLAVQLGGCRAILGSDLEVDAPGGGWRAIVEASQDERAVLFKVPHHGSSTSHEDSVWDEMLHDDVVAAITPFRPEALPRPEMVQRIADRGGRGFLAAPPTRPSQRERPRRTKALQRGSAIRVEEVEGRSGHVRARCTAGSQAGADVVVDLSLPALRLESLLGA